MVVLIRQPSHIQYTLQGRHRRFVGDSAFHTYFGRALLLVGDAAEVASPSATSTEFDSIQLHTTYSVYVGGVQQSVLVEYCTFVYNILLYTSLYLLSTTV